MTDENALEPLQNWPENVSCAIWRSRRALFGDPDLGMPRGSGGEAEYQLGVRCMRDGDGAKAGVAFGKAADAGHAGAMREVADAVFWDLPASLKIAAAPLYERAADLGDARAMCSYAKFVQTGSNPDHALELFKRADDAGDSEGARERGIMLLAMGDKLNARQAMKRSRSRGSASGAFALGNLLEDEFDNREGALAEFRHATKLGHPKAAAQAFRLMWAKGDEQGALEIEGEAMALAQEHRELFEQITGTDNFARDVESSMASMRGVAAGSSCLVSLVAPAVVVGAAVAAMAITWTWRASPSGTWNWMR